MKKNKKNCKELLDGYYELLLFENGSCVEKVNADKMFVFRGEYERLFAFEKTRPSVYKLVVNKYSSSGEFEKNVQ